MTHHAAKRASALTLASSLLWMGLLPATALAAESPAPLQESVVLHASGSAAPVGGTTTFTATVQNPTGVPEFQWWVETPSGRWVDAQNYSPRGSFTLTTPQPGDYLVAVDVLSEQQVAAGDWSQAHTSPTEGVFVDSSVQISTSVSSVPVGHTVTVTAQAHNIFAPLYQFWVGTPDGHGGFSWSQSGAYSENAQYTFTVSQPGLYRVVAFAKSPDAANNAAGALMSPVLASLTAFGPADQVVLSDAKATLVANGAATDQVTATVEDAEGQRVANFNGTIAISPSPADAVTLSPGLSQGTDGTVYAVASGQAIFQVTGVSGASGPVTLNPDHLVLAPGSGSLAANIAYHATTLTLAAPSASLITLSAQPPDLATTPTAFATQVTVGLEDASGMPLTATVPRYIDLTLTGPGSFSASSVQRTLTVLIRPGQQAAQVPVWDTLGGDGTLSITASSPGLISPPALLIPTYPVGAPAGLTVTRAPVSGGTQYTISVVDANGQVIPDGLGSSAALTVSDDTAALNEPALTYTVDGHTYHSGPSAAQSAAFTAQATGGILAFVVSNTAVGSTPVTITVADLADNLEAVTTYQYQTGAVAAAPLTLTTLGVKTGSLTAGQSVTFTAQLTDQYGNPVREADQPVWFRIGAEGSLLTNRVMTPDREVVPAAENRPTVDELPALTPETVYMALDQAGDVSPQGAITIPDPISDGTAVLPNGASRIGDVYEAFTNASGLASVTVHTPASDLPYQAFQLDAAPGPDGVSGIEPTGSWSSGPVYVVIPSGYDTVHLTWTTSDPSFPANDRLPAGQSGTWGIDAINGLGQALGAGPADVFDTWYVTSSAPDRLSVDAPNMPGLMATTSGWLLNLGLEATSAADAEALGTNAAVLPYLTQQWGPATMTVSDVSNPDGAMLTRSTTVVPGRPTHEVLLYHGQPVGPDNPIPLTANQPQPVTVVQEDAGGNPVPVTGLVPLIVGLPALSAGNGNTVEWEPSGGGPPITSVNILPGSASAEVWLVSANNLVLTKLPAPYAELLLSIDRTPGTGLSDALHVAGLAETGQPTTLEISGFQPSPNGDLGTVNTQRVPANGSVAVAVEPNSEGSASVDVTLDDAAPQVLSVVDLTTGASGQVTVTPWADVTALTLSGVSAGTTGPYTNEATVVAAEDPYGNVVSGQSLNSADFWVDGSPAASAPAVGQDRTVIFSTASSVAGATVHVAYHSGLIAAYGQVVAALSLRPSSTSAVAGQAASVLVSGIAQAGQTVVLDVFGATSSPAGDEGYVVGADENSVPFSHGSAEISVTANALGSAAFNLALDDAADETLTVVDLGSHVSGSLTRQVSPGDPVRLALSGVSATLGGGSPYDNSVGVIGAYDAYDNFIDGANLSAEPFDVLENGVAATVTRESSMPQQALEVFFDTASPLSSGATVTAVYQDSALASGTIGANLQVVPATSTPTTGTSDDFSISGMEPVGATTTLTISGVSASPSGDWGTITADGQTATITGATTSSGYGPGSASITVGVSPLGSGSVEVSLDDAASQTVVLTDDATHISGSVTITPVANSSHPELVLGTPLYVSHVTASTYFTDVPLLSEVDQYGNVIAYGSALTATSIVAALTTESRTTTQPGTIYEQQASGTALDVIFTTYAPVPIGTIITITAHSSNEVAASGSTTAN